MAISNLKAEVDGNGFYSLGMNITSPVARGYFKLSRTDGGTFSFNNAQVSSTTWILASNWQAPAGSPAGTNLQPVPYTINGTTYNNVVAYGTLSSGSYTLAAVETLTSGEGTTGTSFHNFNAGGTTPTTTSNQGTVIGRPFVDGNCFWTVRSNAEETIYFKLLGLNSTTVTGEFVGNKQGLASSATIIGGITYSKYYNYGAIPNGDYSLQTISGTGQILNEWAFTVNCANTTTVITTTAATTTSTTTAAPTTTANTSGVLARVFTDGACNTVVKVNSDAVAYNFNLVGRNGSTVPSGLQGNKLSVPLSPNETINGQLYKQQYNYGVIPNGDYTLNTFRSNDNVQVDSYQFSIACGQTTAATTTSSGSFTTIGRVFKENAIHLGRTNNPGDVSFRLSGRNGTAISTANAGDKTAVTSNPAVTYGNITYGKQYNYGLLPNGDYTIKVVNNSNAQILDTFDFTVSGSATTTVTTTSSNTTTVLNQAIARLFTLGGSRVARTNSNLDVSFQLVGRNGTTVPSGLIGSKNAITSNPSVTYDNIVYLKEFNYGNTLANGDYTIKLVSNSTGQQLDTFDITIDNSVTTTAGSSTTTQSSGTTTSGGSNTTTVITTTAFVSGGPNTTIDAIGVGSLVFGCANNYMNVIATFKALVGIPAGTVVGVTTNSLPVGVLGSSIGNVANNILTFSQNVPVNSTFTVTSSFATNCQKSINNASICLVI